MAAANTSALTVRLGGFFDFTYGVVSDEADKGSFRGTGAQSRATTDMRTESEINLYVDGRAANGLQYGAVFELQMDNAQTGAADQTGVPPGFERQVFITPPSTNRQFLRLKVSR